MNRLKILIVEDESIIGYDLQLMFRQQGHEVLPMVSTADLAVETALQSCPDVIVMDVLLKGGQTGLDAARRIQAVRSIPVVFLTGNKKLLDKADVAELKNYRILDKPPLSAELLEAVLNMIPRK